MLRRQFGISSLFRLVAIAALAFTLFRYTSWLVIGMAAFASAIFLAISLAQFVGLALAETLVPDSHVEKLTPKARTSEESEEGDDRAT